MNYEAFRIILLQRHKKFRCVIIFLSSMQKKNSSGQMRQISRRMEMIHPTIGWRRDEHGTHKHAHGSCMDSLTCITCSLENNAFSVLHYVMVALHYSVLHRFETFSAPGKITHGSIRLPPRNLASSRGCSLAIIFANMRASKSTYYLLYDKAHSNTHHNYNSTFNFVTNFIGFTS